MPGREIAAHHSRQSDAGIVHIWRPSLIRRIGGTARNTNSRQFAGFDKCVELSVCVCVWRMFSGRVRTCFKFRVRVLTHSRIAENTQHVRQTHKQSSYHTHTQLCHSCTYEMESSSSHYQHDHRIYTFIYRLGAGGRAPRAHKDTYTHVYVCKNSAQKHTHTHK